MKLIEMKNENKKLESYVKDYAKNLEAKVS